MIFYKRVDLACLAARLCLIGSGSSVPGSGVQNASQGRGFGDSDMRRELKLIVDSVRHGWPTPTPYTWSLLVFYWETAALRGTLLYDWSTHGS